MSVAGCWKKSKSGSEVGVEAAGAAVVPAVVPFNLDNKSSRDNIVSVGRYSVTKPPKISALSLAAGQETATSRNSSTHSFALASASALILIDR